VSPMYPLVLLTVRVLLSVQNGMGTPSFRFHLQPYGIDVTQFAVQR
jgi:hypothetical protein